YSTSGCSGDDDFPEFDIGKYLGKSTSMTRPQKLDILKKCWSPPKSYDFSKDVAERRIYSQRKFIHDWLTTYAPWLTYSKKLKGALCLYCVLFPPTVVQGVLRSFIVTPFTRYKNMHEECKNHAQSKWHKQATTSANSFLNVLPVNVVAISGHQSLIENNRKILSSIISTIIFCGTHDLPLRGKESQTGVFHDLIKFKIDAGDEILKKHIEEGKKNASYLSVQIQNEIVDLLGRTIQEILIEDVKKSPVYSIMADETADMSGKEQLSIGVRFFDEHKMIVREECLGFIELNAMDAKTIANFIDNFIQNHGLDPMKCVGQGYDGCSTMSGDNAGVQKILKQKYPKALYFHCASHKINLVVNDSSSVPEIRNTISTVK
ncbi:zinc finger MYM-type protein 1-like, partial [Contarinia nasturtii]|uniref:zinc finger MYM-type protein 1-like n=1 Tax=Contarinia nasturtii TaxID=265458 RepID=UPI0012D4A2E0